MAYSPKYITLDDIPVQIPDDYSSQEKQDALEYAETMVELDLYNGEDIPDKLISSKLIAAIKQKATCELAKGSEHPDDTALGDLDDSGSTKVDYSMNAFCERYDELVDAILQQGGIDQESTEDESDSPYTYSTSKADDDCNDRVYY
jgi:hypothetical protein